jgi:hypothetical protein
MDDTDKISNIGGTFLVLIQTLLRPSQRYEVVRVRLREHISAVLSEPNVSVAFRKRMLTVLNGADKVASICTDLAVFQLMVLGNLGASTNCAYDSRTEHWQRLRTSCELCCSANLRRI